jgi:hypothetical protein
MAPGNNRLRSAKNLVSYLTVAIVPVIQDKLTRLKVSVQFSGKNFPVFSDT